MNYTREQHAAVYTHDHNLIVVAGAGSGKTRVLVDRFVALLDAYPDWHLSALVAITFTEKAAREMRDRVRQAIENRVAAATDQGNPAILKRWRDCQSALDSARIGTIHSLCASILRANAAAIGIDPGFVVLDELDAAIIADQAVEESLAVLAASDQPIGGLLHAYDVAKVREALRANLYLRTDQLIDYGDGWQAACEQHVAEVIAQLLHDSVFLEVLRWTPQGGWPSPSDKLMQVWQGIHDTRDGLYGAEPLSVLQTWVESIDLRGGSAKTWGDSLAEAKACLKWLRDRAKAVLAEIGDPYGESDKFAAALVPTWIEAILQTQTLYREIKHTQRSLDFDDLERKTCDLLRTDAKVVARYCGAEFRHLLVDEFQDTNEAQRDIITALAGVTTPGSLFVVGDPKQSIYGFRGADVSVFSDIRRKTIAQGGQEIALSTSFRGHTRLVDGFNAIFGGLFGTESDADRADYDISLGEAMRAQRPSEAHHTASLEIILIDPDKAPKEANKADDLRQWEAYTVALRLQAMVQDGTRIWDGQGYRAIQYGDIAVLFQASRSMPLLEETLKTLGLPYVTIAGKGYFDRPEVADLLNLLKALYNPLDNLALASALRSPLFNFSDDDLLALRLQRIPSNPDAPIMPLWAALMGIDHRYEPALPDPVVVAFAREALRPLQEIAGRITIAELITRILDVTAYLATISGLADGARRVGNVEKLIEMARHRGRIDLGTFTAYLQDLTDREAREGEALVASEGAIRLMTIHASKGLEFPVVVLFDASWTKGKSSKPTLMPDPTLGLACLLYDDSGKGIEPFAYRRAQQYHQQRVEAERKRLLYVGMTRAKDYVIVSGRTNGGGPWLDQLGAILGLPASIAADAVTPDQMLIQQPWGECLLRIPLTLPPALVPTRTDAHDGWSMLTDQPMPGVGVYQPPLLTALKIDRTAPARLLSAKEIATLGEARAVPDIAQFRSHVLRGAPISIREVANPDIRTDVSSRIVGEIVHEALRWGRLPGNTPGLDKMLQNYAWERGVVDPDMLDKTVKVAQDLLARTERSHIIDQMAQASQIYRELPFTFKVGQRVINGVIDVLFLSKRGQWTVVDYKTGSLPYAKRTGDNIADMAAHGVRYHAQVGIYAAAVEHLMGQPPDVYLHYVRYAYSLKVEAADWRAALDTLDADIADALSGETDS